MNKTVSTWIALLIAINLTGLGVALFVQANLGSDTITVFVDGFKNVLGTSIGGASRVYNLIALLIALVLSRKDIGWCTIVYALTVGYAMDFYNGIFSSFNIEEMGLLIRFIVVLMGQMCFVFTYVLLIVFRKGMNQMDAIAYGIVHHTKLSYALVRTGIDILLLVTGWLMGGVIGIGSVVAMATTGYLVSRFVDALKKHESFMVLKEK